jgi:RimJ/RimL family protein N-acetyltransferase
MTAAGAVTIEPLAADEVATVAAWLSDPEINRWLTSDWRGRTIDPAIIALAMRNKKNRFYLTRDDGSPCGLVALADIDMVDGLAMVWYVLGSRDRGGRGVTSMAVRRLAAIAFNELGLGCLYAWIIDDNARSRRVLENAGFREAGTIRDAVLRDGLRLCRRYFDLVPHDLIAGT